MEERRLLNEIIFEPVQAGQGRPFKPSGWLERNARRGGNVHTRIRCCLGFGVHTKTSVIAKAKYIAWREK